MAFAEMQVPLKNGSSKAGGGPSEVMTCIASKRSTSSGVTWSPIVVNVTWPAGVSAHRGKVGEPAPLWDRRNGGVLRLFFQSLSPTPPPPPHTTLSCGDSPNGCPATVWGVVSTDKGRTFSIPVPAFPTRDSAGGRLNWAIGGQQATQLRSGRILIGGYTHWPSSPGIKGRQPDGGVGGFDINSPGR
jgi:hypothetical protein